MKCDNLSVMSTFEVQVPTDMLSELCSVGNSMKLEVWDSAPDATHEDFSSKTKHNCLVIEKLCDSIVKFVVTAYQAAAEEDSEQGSHSKNQISTSPSVVSLMPPVNDDVVSDVRSSPSVDLVTMSDSKEIINFETSQPMDSQSDGNQDKSVKDEERTPVSIPDVIESRVENRQNNREVQTDPVTVIIGDAKFLLDRIKTFLTEITPEGGSVTEITPEGGSVPNIQPETSSATIFAAGTTLSAASVPMSSQVQVPSMQSLRAQMVQPAPRIPSNQPQFLRHKQYTPPNAPQSQARPLHQPVVLPRPVLQQLISEMRRKPVVGGQYSCPFCPLTFIESPALYSHLNIFHHDQTSKVKQPKGREGKTTMVRSQVKEQSDVSDPGSLRGLTLCNDDHKGTNEGLGLLDNAALSQSSSSIVRSILPEFVVNTQIVQDLQGKRKLILLPTITAIKRTKPD